MFPDIQIKKKEIVKEKILMSKVTIYKDLFSSKKKDSYSN